MQVSGLQVLITCGRRALDGYPRVAVSALGLFACKLDLKSAFATMGRLGRDEGRKPDRTCRGNRMLHDAVKENTP